MNGRWIVGLLVVLGGAACGQERREITVHGKGVEARFVVVRVPTTRPFWIGRTEVTWGEFRIFDQALDLPAEQRAKAVEERTQSADHPGHCIGSVQGVIDPQHPAVAVHPQYAARYCAWLSAQTGKRFRLATEAEWEVACRAGDEADPVGEALKESAWFGEGEAGKTHTVATKRPNAWGLYDMLGNAEEWVVGAKGPVLKGGSSRDAVVQSRGGRAMNAELQERDPHDPKLECCLSDGPAAGFRLVMEE